jgi:ribosome-binding protein aMBF1 (putative translation factor)
VATKKKQKTFSSVEEMLKGTGASPEFIQEFKEYSSKREFRKQLCSLRLKVGIDEKELSKKLGVKKSWVEKMESSVDDEMTVCDIKLYLKGLGYNLKLDVIKAD